jgi:hypothetical protein
MPSPHQSGTPTSVSFYTYAWTLLQVAIHQQRGAQFKLIHFSYVLTPIPKFFFCCWLFFFVRLADDATRQTIFLNVERTKYVFLFYFFDSPGLRSLMFSSGVNALPHGSEFHSTKLV